MGDNHGSTGKAGGSSGRPGQNKNPLDGVVAQLSSLENHFGNEEENLDKLIKTLERELAKAKPQPEPPRKGFMDKLSRSGKGRG